MPTNQSYRLCAEAQRLIQLGRHEEAIPVLLGAAAANPDAALPHNLLAQCHYARKRYAEARVQAERAASLQPTSEWAHRLRALSLMNLKRNREALAAAREAVSLAPHAPEALYALALCLSANKRRDEAREAATQMVRIAPDRALSHFTAGLMAHRAGQWSEAETHYRRALTLDAENWEAMNNLGVVLNKQGRTREAIDMYHNAARLRPGEATSRNNLKQSVGGYVGGGFGALFLLSQVVRAVAGVEGGRESSIAPFLILGLIAAGIGYYYWRRQRRLAELHETVKTFYTAEVRRERRESWRIVGMATLVSLTALSVFFWSIGALTDSPAAVGLTSWPGLLYAALWIALGAEVWWLLRRRAGVQRR